MPFSIDTSISVHMYVYIYCADTVEMALKDVEDQLSNLLLEDEDEDFYVHIDVLRGVNQNKQPNAPSYANAINKHMIMQDSYDPRRAFNFPTDLLMEGEVDNLPNRREAAGITSTYYEFWKVRKTFSLAGFQEMVAGLQQFYPRIKVRLVKVINNDHQINEYP